MSSYLKQGERTSQIKHKQNAKRHYKRFYKLLHQLDLVAKAMIKSGIAIKESNVVEEAAKYTDAEIGNYEKMILLAKVNEVYEKLGIEVKDNGKDNNK
jgi:hypothetical protein